MNAGMPHVPATSPNAVTGPPSLGMEQNLVDSPSVSVPDPQAKASIDPSADQAGFE
jgi:hypothetical protein